MATFTAAGDETDDYSNAAPGIFKSSDGHTEMITFRGTMHYKARFAGGRWAESSPAGELTSISHTIDGISQPELSITPPAGSGTYTCKGSALTVIQEAVSGSPETTIVFAKGG